MSDSSSKLMVNTLVESMGQGDWPIIRNLERLTDRVVLEIHVPESLAVFKGHFPEEPVLPGVVQIHWAAEFALRLFKLCQDEEIKTSLYSGHRGIRFNSMVLPGAQLKLELAWDQNNQKIRFSYTELKRKVSSGILLFKGEN